MLQQQTWPEQGTPAAEAEAGRLARQSDWKIVERGWDAHVLGEASNRFTDPVQAVKKLRVRTRAPSNAVRAGAEIS